MMTYLPFKTLIDSKDELVEGNLIRLIKNTLHIKKMEIVYNTTEKKFYVYNGQFWEGETLDEVINIFWQTYNSEIFDLLKKDLIELRISYKKESDKTNPDEMVKAELKRIIERTQFLYKMQHNQVEKLVKSLSMAIEHLKDENYNKIPLLNGYVDIEENFSFHKLDSKIYNRYCLDFNYYPNKKDTKEPIIFLNFLSGILPDKEAREFLLNWLAHLFVSGNHRQKSLFFFGAGRNGKGVLTRIVYKLLGERNCSSLNVKQLSHLNSLNNVL